MIKECRLFDKVNGLKIDVTRKAGHVLAPSWDLLMAYKRGEITWAQYVERYQVEISGNDAQAELVKISELAKNQDVYLACYCTSEVECHRYLLVEMIEDLWESDWKAQGEAQWDGL